jgi:hypothetical protein
VTISDCGAIISDDGKDHPIPVASGEVKELCWRCFSRVVDDRQIGSRGSSDFSNWLTKRWLCFGLRSVESELVSQVTSQNGSTYSMRSERTVTNCQSSGQVFRAEKSEGLVTTN